MISSRKNEKKIRHNSGHIKNSEIKYKHKEKKKTQSQNKNIDPEAENSLGSESSIFTDINKIIINKLANQKTQTPTDSVGSGVAPYPNKIKQTAKLEKLIKKIM